MQSGYEPLSSPADIEPQPLLLHETVEVLMQSGGPRALYVDGSFGRGGHAAEILRLLAPDGRLIAFDANPRVAEAARKLAVVDQRLRFYRRRCRDLQQVLGKAAPAGVLLDLGAQLTPCEERDHGLSYKEAVPLDGRLDPSTGLPLDAWLQSVSSSKLASVLQEAEDWSSPLLAQRLAEAILHRQQQQGAYRSTLELAEVCCKVKHSDDRGLHPAKMCFTALRSHLNQELHELRGAMEAALASLKLGGRLIIITTRRKEASEVKRFIREHEAPDLRFADFVSPRRFVELFPMSSSAWPYACRQLCEPIRASASEVARNPRAKVALLHVLQKEERSIDACVRLGLLGLVPRPLSQQFRTPAVLPLHTS